jgi:hypothetical protein
MQTYTQFRGISRNSVSCVIQYFALKFNFFIERFSTDESKRQKRADMENSVDYPHAVCQP